jgi:hypothetical protein
VVYALATEDARPTLRPVGEKFGLDKMQFEAAAKRDLIMMHHEIIRQNLVRPGTPGA